MTIGNVTVTPQDLTREAGSGAGNTILFIGYASGGSASAFPVRIAREDDLEDAIGFGMLPVFMAPALKRRSNQYAYKLTGSGASAGSVTQSGSGPAVTLTGTPRGSFPSFKVEITKAGTTASGSARFKYTLDGETWSEDIDIPAPTPAELVSTIDFSTITLSSLNTKHFTLETEDGNPVDVTMTTPANFAALRTALLSGITTDTSNATILADLREGKYMVIQSGVTGSASTIDAASGDGMDELGLDGQTATGTDSAYAIPGVGVTVNFASGTHVLGTTHSAALVGPKPALSAFEAAIDALPRDGSIEFSAIAICYEFVDAAEALTFETSLAAKLAAWQTNEPYRPVGLLFPMPLGSTSATKSTRDTAHQTNDLAVRAAFSSTNHEVTWWAHGDCWVSGGGWLGSFRRSSLIAEIIQFVSLDESRSIGERLDSIPDVSMTGPDGLTKARDEHSALVEMADRWSVLISRGGAPYFMTGRTASTSDGFKELAWLRPLYHAMQVAHDVLWSKLEGTFVLDKAGKLAASGAQKIDDDADGQLGVEIINPPGARQRASRCYFRYDRTNVLGTTKKLAGTLFFQALGIAHEGAIAAQLTTEIV